MVIGRQIELLNYKPIELKIFLIWYQAAITLFCNKAPLVSFFRVTTTFKPLFIMLFKSKSTRIPWSLDWTSQEINKYLQVQMHKQNDQKEILQRIWQCNVAMRNNLILNLSAKCCNNTFLISLFEKCIKHIQCIFLFGSIRYYKKFPYNFFCDIQYFSVVLFNFIVLLF